MAVPGAFSTLILAAVTTLSAQSTYTLNILHLNDTHSNLQPLSIAVSLDSTGEPTRIPAGGVALIASEVRRTRMAEENVIFLHAGDMVQGTLFYTVYGGQADAAVYNSMGLDVMAPGNHEFDRGSAGFRALLDEVLFPVVCANLSLEGDSLLAGRVAPVVIIETGGERIGVIGLITEELASVSSPSANTVATPMLEAGMNAVALLERQGVNKIVALTHAGYMEDLELAATLPGVDVIVGGHSHTFLGDFSGLGLESGGEYPTVVEGPLGDTVLVVTAWRYAVMLGRLGVDFDSEGRVTGWRGSPVILTSDSTAAVAGLLFTTPDPVVGELVDSYTAAIEDFQSEVLARAESDLPNARVPGGALPGGSAIAPVICDALLWKADLMGMDADIALQNAGGVRIDVSRGDITIGTVYTLLPFGNTMAVLDLSGEEIRVVFEEALSTIFDEGRSDGTFPYVAGMRYEAAKVPVDGHRVLSIEVKGADGTYAPIDPAASYRVVTNSFVAGGGDGFGSLKGRTWTDTGFIDAEILMEYLHFLGTVSPVEQRVFFSEN